MSNFNKGQVCCNGHVITGNMRSGFDSRHCPKCGQPSVVECASCHEPIRGTWKESFGYEWDAPAHCHECGAPYPWTLAKFNAVQELADAIDELTSYEKEVLAELMPHLVQETPRTTPAGFKVAAIVGKLREPGKMAFKRILEEIVVEAGKKALGF